MASKAGKWIGIGCGSILVLGLVAGVAGYFFVWKPAKEKLAKEGVDFSGDAKSIAGSMVMVGVKQVKPKLLEALPAEERAQVDEAITLLDGRRGKFQPEDFQALGEAFKAFSQSMKDNGGTPTPEAAQRFGSELKRLADSLKGA